MTSRDLARIAARRAELTGRADSLRRQFDDMVAASEWNRDDDEHDPEGATIAFERAQVSDLLARTRTELAELDAAEQRVKDGSYGTCQRCARPIAAGRLEARPAATECIDCANRRRGPGR